MRDYHKRTPRLFVEAELHDGGDIELNRDQAHYLLNVMRLKPGDGVRCFSDNQGEWRCIIKQATKKQCVIACQEQLADPQLPPDIDYYFAPLKHARLDYIVQKATEMGARRIGCVFTERTISSRVNLSRMHANAIEAAEQCNLLAVPKIMPEQKLSALLDGWDDGRKLVFCDEQAALADPVKALEQLDRGPLAVLLGPEGGFSPDEAERLRRQPYVVPVSLGPRIMRADTAGVAAMALLQAVLGDWH